MLKVMILMNYILYNSFLLCIKYIPRTYFIKLKLYDFLTDVKSKDLLLA